MKLREGIKTIQPKYLNLLKYFLIAATVIAILGIFLVTRGDYPMESRYLTILSATIACQGVWGAVFFDCLHRRLNQQ